MLSRIIKGWPNTYTFTKALAEKMLLQLGDKLPIVIVRPSIGKFQLTLVQIIVINYIYKTRVCTNIKHHLFQSRIALIYFYFLFYLLHFFVIFLYKHSYSIVERTDIRMGRQFKWTDGFASWRRQRGSEDTAVS